MDTSTGKDRWRTTLGPTFKNPPWGDGPRSTPTVDGDRLYVIRGGGGLHCLDAKSGKIVWSKDFRKDFQGQLMSGWGYSESPLIDGNLLICSPGGGAGTIVALDKASGKLVWRSKDVRDAAAYSSVIVADVDGVRQYIQLTGKGVVGVRAKDGAKLWYYEREGHRTAVIPTAIYHAGHVYVTAGYGCGCDLIKLTKEGNTFKADQVYANKNMVNHHGGVVLLDGFVYGFSDGKGWVCQDFMSGKTNWEEKGRGRPGKGSVTCVAGHLFCYDEGTGNLYVTEANPKAWKDKGMLSLPKKTDIRSKNGRIWTHPVIANGKLYLRDQDLLFCFDMSAQ
jgi:outer membrane protein assembly factor BamB